MTAGQRRRRAQDADNALQNIRRAERLGRVPRHEQVEIQRGELIDQRGRRTGRVDRAESGVKESYWTAKIPRRQRLARRFFRRNRDA